MATRKKPKKRTVKKAKRSVFEELFCGPPQPNNDKLFKEKGRAYYMELERNSLAIESKYLYLRDRLRGFLDSDQLEAAKIAGCTPELYALEWIEICKESLVLKAPAFGNNVERFK